MTEGGSQGLNYLEFVKSSMKTCVLVSKGEHAEHCSIITFGLLDSGSLRDSGTKELGSESQDGLCYSATTSSPPSRLGPPPHFPSQGLETSDVRLTCMLPVHPGPLRSLLLLILIQFPGSGASTPRAGTGPEKFLPRNGTHFSLIF